MNFFRSAFVFCSLSIISSFSFAQKMTINSGVCGQPVFATSSGTVVRFQNQNFVLASADHILNSAGACQTATTSDGKSAALKIVRFDVAAGLALLSAPAEISAGALEVKSQNLSLLMKVHWNGGAGRVSSARSTRHHFLPAEGIAEIKATALSNDLVGQPILNDRGELAGVISNQFIEEVPGQGARVRRFRDASPAASSVLLALPSTRLATWMQSALASNWQAPFEITAQDQLDGVVRWTSGAITWKQNCPAPDSPRAGGEFPIGGVDPVGIGGDSAGSPACLFTPSLASAARSDIGRAEWNARIAQRLRAGEVLTLRLGAYRSSNVLIPLPAVSIGQFAQLYSRNDVSFVVTRKEAPAETDPLMIDLRLKARQSFAQVVTFPYGSLALRQRAYLATLISMTEDWRSITANDLDVLTKECDDDQTMIMHIPTTLRELTEARRRLP